MNSHNIKSVKNQVQLQNWASQIKQQQESGMSVASWCRLNEIKAGTYYHRLNKVRSIMLENMAENQIIQSAPVLPKTFAELDLPKLSEEKTNESSVGTVTKIAVYLNGITIEIPSNAPAESIAAVLNVVKAL